MPIVPGLHLDFESRGLSQSPCKNCKHRERLPSCIEACEVIASVQRLMGCTIACHHTVDEEEGYRVARSERGNS